MPDETKEDTLTMRAVRAVGSVTTARGPIGRGAQLGGYVLWVLVLWHGVEPSLHVWLRPGEPHESWPLWAVLLCVAGGIGLTAGADKLAAIVRAVLPFFGRAQP